MNVLIVDPSQMAALYSQRTALESFGDDVAVGTLGPIMIVIGVDYFDPESEGNLLDQDPNHMSFILPDGQVITDN